MSSLEHFKAVVSGFLKIELKCLLVILNAHNSNFKKPYFSFFEGWPTVQLQNNDVLLYGKMVLDDTYFNKIKVKIYISTISFFGLYQTLIKKKNIPAILRSFLDPVVRCCSQMLQSMFKCVNLQDIIILQSFIIKFLQICSVKAEAPFVTGAKYNLVNLPMIFSKWSKL